MLQCTPPPSSKGNRDINTPSETINFPKTSDCISEWLGIALRVASQSKCFGCLVIAHGCAKASRGFEPRSLDSESRVLTVTPRGQMFVAAHLCARA